MSCRFLHPARLTQRPWLVEKFSSCYDRADLQQTPRVIFQAADGPQLYVRTEEIPCLQATCARSLGEPPACDPELTAISNSNPGDPTIRATRRITFGSATPLIPQIQEKTPPQESPSASPAESTAQPTPPALPSESPGPAQPAAAPVSPLIPPSAGPGALPTPSPKPTLA